MSAFDELERLLDAERECEPPAGAAEAGWVKLDAALAAGTPALTIAAGPLNLTLMTTGKWAAIGMSTLALGSGGAWVAARHESAPPAASAGVVKSAPALPRVVAVPAPTALPSAEPKPPAPPSHAAPSSSTARPQTFDEELRLIQLAKSELDAGRPHLARVWLGEHASRFPGGVFATERVALGLLMDCGKDPDGSRGRAQAFARAHRESPMVDRVLRACGLENGSGAEREPTDER